MATLQQALKPLFNKTYNRYSKDLKDKYIITTDNSGNITGKVSVGSLLSNAKYSGGYIADGVMVTQNPQAGDILFLDDEGIRVFVKNANDELVKENLPESWMLVGYVFHRGKTDIITGETDDLNLVWVINKDGANYKYLDVWQYAITAIASTSITITLRLSTDYTVGTDVPITLSSIELNATTASEISTAIRAKAAEVSSAGTWWAYYDKVNDRIIVQNDVNNDYRQYQVSGTGCTIALSVWDDMPANSTSGVRQDNGSGGVMNAARGTIYYTTNGTADTSLGLTNSDIMNKESFDNSANADVIAYKNGGKTYDDYIREYKMLALPQPRRQGLFTLPVAQQLSLKYAPSAAPTYSGGEKYKFPALYAGYNVSYGGDLDFGDWWTTGVQEALYFMRDIDDGDNAFTKLAASATKMGTLSFANNVNRWLAQRYDAYGNWVFYSNGYINHINMAHSYCCQAVTCLYL